MIFDCDDGINSTLANVTELQHLYTCSKYMPSFHWWVEVPVIGILCVIGMVANALALLVWRSEASQKRSTFLLQVLAITDNFYLLIAVFVLPLKCLLPQLELGLKRVSPLMLYLQNTAQSLCIWMIVLVTVERFVYVCRPMHASLLLDMPMKCRLVWLVCGACFVYNLPYLFCYCVWGWYKQLRPGVDGYLLEIGFSSISRFVLMFLIPMLSLAVMSARLVRTMSSRRRHQTLSSIGDVEQMDISDVSGTEKQSRGRSNGFDVSVENCPTSTGSTRLQLLRSGSHLVSNSRSSQERRTTILLGIIVLIFVLCQLPEVMYNIAYFHYLSSMSRGPDYFGNGNANFSFNHTFNEAPVINDAALLMLHQIDYLAPISHLTVVINSSANFFVYLLFGNRFRQKLVEIFKRRHT